MASDEQPVASSLQYANVKTTSEAVNGEPSDHRTSSRSVHVIDRPSAATPPLPAVGISVALACLAGYALAIYRFRLALPLFFLFVAGNFVPFQILMVPVRDMSVQTGLYNTIAGQFLFHAAFQTGFCTLFMRNFIKALPFDLIESARVEGVAEWRIFWFIIVPLVRPAIAALAVLIFTFVWNDFFWANVLSQGEQVKPITAGVRALNGQFVSNWQLVSAASLLAAVPPVAMFFFMQKHFIAGLTLGAVK